MIRQLAESKLRRPIAQFMALLMMNFAIPANLYAYDPSKPVELKEEVQKQPASRALTAKEMKSMRGRTGGNPYYAGQAKFDVVYKGVNLRTGNYSTSATDLSFEGGYGIPVNVTRSYSANSIDEGPLGVGWNLSADLRSTAGGLLKSASAPVRSVPVGMKRRPSTEVDPNVPTQPIEAVIVTDADGKETTVQRDVDGILTTPPWDKNEYETEYEYVTLNNQVYWILKSNKTMTPDGTVYQYEKKGSYVNGSKPWNDANATAEPNNILKPVWVEDRHGNKTNYTYGTTDVQFTKANGLVAEKPLIGVDMPNGRSIEFIWTGNRITQVRAFSSNEERSVLYGYTNGQLTSTQNKRVLQGQSPELGRITQYGYSGSVLTSITDPRGLTTSIGYSTNITVDGYSYPGDSLRVVSITEPTGVVENFVIGYTGGNQTARIYRAGTATTPSEEQYVAYVSTPTALIVAEETDNAQIVNPGGTPNPGLDTTQRVQSSKVKYFDPVGYNLVEEQVGVNRPGWLNVIQPGIYHAITRKTMSYNFLGNPLKEQNFEYGWPTSFGQGSLLRSSSTETAYWGEEKYFQQKAVKVTAGAITRYSYTDYFDQNAAQGSKGQTYRVYDTKHANFTFTGSYPAWAAAYAWKYQIAPADPSKYSAQFQYDSKGRPTNVWKLQRVVSGNHQFVQTQSTYGADNAPAYGNATTVVEDYQGPTPRTTQTLAFDLLGKAIQTQDAVGRVFSTNYDADGNILSVQQGSQPVVTYTYGTAHHTANNGQPLTIVDGLSGVEQTVSYIQSGNLKGMPETVTEWVSSAQSSSSTYTYDSQGNKITSTTTTPNGTVRYKYSNYGFRGTGVGPTRVFTRINKQEFVSGSWVNSQEEVRYQFDGLGRMRKVMFAMTAQANATNFDANDTPKSFVSAEYEDETSGRQLGVRHYWNQLSGSVYQREAIRGATAAYNHALGLKTSTSFLTRQGAGSDVFSTVRTETYAYDPHFDYLTGVSYNDGLANSNQNWTYDAAGNRISDTAQPGTWSYDNLNRMTASPGATYVHDVVGNRLSKSAGSASATYTWDAVNRMTGYQVASQSLNHQYVYRADGMRVRAEKGTQVDPWVTRTYYDGQMPIEEDTHSQANPGLVVTQNFLGARGLEAMTTKVGSNAPTTSYPLYDVHGNMVAAVAKGLGGTSWTIQDERSYDAWGSVRSGSATGGPRGRYCANLGHVQDDESGLVYMRARYYEPGSGRFLSEDPARDGVNWYVYASSIPTLFGDFNGKNPLLVFLAIVATGVVIGACIGAAGSAGFSFGKKGYVDASDVIDGAVMGAFMGLFVGLLVAITVASGGAALPASVAGLSTTVSATSVGAILAEAFVLTFVGGALAAAIGAIAGVARKAIDSALGRQMQVSLWMRELDDV